MKTPKVVKESGKFCQELGIENENIEHISPTIATKYRKQKRRKSDKKDLNQGGMKSLSMDSSQLEGNMLM